MNERLLNGVFLSYIELARLKTSDVVVSSTNLPHERSEYRAS